jgi:hypothetical protein
MNCIMWMVKTRQDLRIFAFTKINDDTTWFLNIYHGEINYLIANKVINLEEWQSCRLNSDVKC